MAVPENLKAGPTDVDVYASAYAAPGAMRAGFELYRAFDRDAEDVTATILPGTAHWLAEEHPEAFVDAVLTFTAPGSARAA